MFFGVCCIYSFAGVLTPSDFFPSPCSWSCARNSYSFPSNSSIPTKIKTDSNKCCICLIYNSNKTQNLLWIPCWTHSSNLFRNYCAGNCPTSVAALAEMVTEEWNAASDSLVTCISLLVKLLISKRTIMFWWIVPFWDFGINCWSNSPRPWWHTLSR